MRFVSILQIGSQLVEVKAGLIMGTPGPGLMHNFGSEIERPKNIKYMSVQAKLGEHRLIVRHFSPTTLYARGDRRR
jgi:hypothetical protein